jgi:4-hydroxy-tetrahydrodipicolinate synthase
MMTLQRLVEFHVANRYQRHRRSRHDRRSPTLSVEEHIGVVRTVVRRAAKRIPVIAGTGANSTREAIELTQLAKDAGADACLMVTPYYNKPTQEGLFQHYKAVAERVSIPIILYNVPSRTSCDMKPETVERLAMAVPNIVGIKEAASLERNREHFARVGGRLALLSGDDDLACECVLAGYQGSCRAPTSRPGRWNVIAGLDGNRELARARRADAAAARDVPRNEPVRSWAVARPPSFRMASACRWCRCRAVPRAGDGGDSVSRHRVCLTDVGQ